MCGRYTHTRNSADLSALFEAADETGGALAPDYNVAPTKLVPIVRAGPDGRVLCLARWGLHPPWAARGPAGSGRPTPAGPAGSADGSASPDPTVPPTVGEAAPGRSPAPGEVAPRVSGGSTRGRPRPAGKAAGGRYTLINARAETVARSRAFAPSYRSRRCLVPADGWYEWRRGAGRRQPYYMTSRDGGPLVFAGLWAPGPEGAPSVAVLTVAAVGELATVHDRMPLLLPTADWGGWLAGSRGAEAPPRELCAGLELRPVGAAVGDVRNGGPELIRRVGTTPATDSGATAMELPMF